jgi:hypothetical protein
MAFLPSELLLPVGAVRDIGDSALVTDTGAHAVGVVALVGNHHCAPIEAFEQGRGAGYVVIVAGRDQEADRAAFCVDARVDLRGEAASASTHTTNSTLFLTPEAC